MIFLKYTGNVFLIIYLKKKKLDLYKRSSSLSTIFPLCYNNDFTVTSNETLENERGTIEEKKNSQSYYTECVESLDRIHFDNGDFDDNILY